MGDIPAIRRVCMFLGLLAISAWAWADVVRLKNGNVLEGKIVAQTSREVRIRTGASEITVPRDQVASVEKGEAPFEVYKKRAAALKPDDTAGHYALAEYCLEHRLFTEAIAELRRTLELQKDHPHARAKLLPLLDQRAGPLLARARRLQAQGKYEEAEEPLIAVLEKYPDSSLAAAAQHYLAVGFAARKQYDMALTRWRRALALDPTLVEACEGAARAAAETGQWAEALDFTERAIRNTKDPRRAKSLRERAAALSKLVELQKKAGGQGAAKDPARLAAEAAVMMQLGQRERAYARYLDAYDAGARDPALLRLLCDYCERAGRIRLALELCRELVTKNPADDELVRRRARIEQLLLVPRAFATRDKAERERLLFQIARSGASFQAIEGALRESAERDPQKPGLAEGTCLVDDLLLPARYLAYVPKGYDPRRPWPLVLAFHRNRETAKEHFYNWETVAKTEKLILVFPVCPAKSGWKTAHLKIPCSLLHHLAKVYNVDTNRVYISGAGSGGQLAWAAALRWPDRFAALVVRNAALDEVSRLYLRSAVNLPTYLIVGQHGAADAFGSQLEAYRAMNSWGYDVRREEVPGYSRNPSFPELNVKVMGWLEDKRRDPYTPRVRLVSFEAANAGAFWIYIEKFADTVFDPDRPVAIKAPFGQEYDPRQLRLIYLGEMAKGMAQVIAAVAPGNRIHLVTKHVDELTVFLDDKMVDLDKPVRIVANGEVVFQGQVKRSLEQLFDSARLHRDPRLCYAAAVRIRIPKD